MIEREKFEAIADEIARLTGFRRDAVRPNTRLYHDAGLAGLDYGDFLVWFSSKYSVDLSGLKVSSLAPGEGSSIGFFFPRRYLELTVQDFLELSNCPSWKASGLADRKSRT